jgi:flagellar hook-associated protein FlgK
MIHFQQSYSAAAKIISVDEQMFTSVLSAMGG